MFDSLDFIRLHEKLESTEKQIFQIKSSFQGDLEDLHAQQNELESALELANKAYSFGVDAIIVQDLGLANLLIQNFPSLPIHASTQMTVHNLEGVKVLEELGFKRVVLARELSLEEIEYIVKNTSCEIEVFAHGALCISYSGRCYISSLIGGGDNGVLVLLLEKELLIEKIIIYHLLIIIGLVMHLMLF